MTSPFLVPNRDGSNYIARPKASGGTVHYSIPGVAFLGARTRAVPAANVDMYQPWVLQSPAIVLEMACEVTGTAGTNFRIGFYAADLDWQPTGAPLADSGNLSSASATVKTYTPSTPIYLPPGRYLSVVNADNTPTLRRAVSGGPAAGGAFDSTVSANVGVIEYTVSRALAAFPTPGTKWTGVNGGGAVSCYVFYKLSAA